MFSLGFKRLVAVSCCVWATCFVGFGLWVFAAVTLLGFDLCFLFRSFDMIALCG